MSAKHKNRDNTQLVYDPSNPTATPVRLKKRRGPYKKRTAEGSAADDPSQESSSGQNTSSSIVQGGKRRKRAVSPEWQPGLAFRAAAGARLIPGAGSVNPANEQLQEEGEPTQAAMNGMDELEPAMPDAPSPGPATAEVGIAAQPASRKRKSNAKREAKKEAYPRWKDVVLPSVTIPFLRAEALRAEGKPLCPLPSESSLPAQGSGSTVGDNCPNFLRCGKTLRQSVVQCVRFTRFFPSSSAFPNVAFSFDILEHHMHLSPQHTTPMHATRAGLVHLLSINGADLNGKEPFSAQLPEAMDWYNVLKRRIETMVYNVLSQVETEAAEFDETGVGGPKIPTYRDRADPYLRRRCPLCFGRSTWGGDPDTDPDVIVCLDGNMQHKRWSNVGDDPEMLSEDQFHFFLSDREIRDAREHVEAKRPSKTSQTGRKSSAVPSGALDECRDSHHAAQERADEEDSGKFASKGVMAIVCRHDVPLFLCDIQSPGERQYFAIALLRRLASKLPPLATIGVLYDIGCHLDRSIELHDFIPELAPRLAFAVSVFHAYAHQFCCQMVFHPRKRTGFGWSNGEGNERIWALSRDLISNERIMGPHKRIFALERKMEHIAELKCSKLGNFIVRKRKAIAQAKLESENVLSSLEAADKGEWTAAKLEEQWQLQKSHQLSAESWNNQQASKSLTSLINAQRTATTLSRNLDEVYQAISAQELQDELQDTHDPARLTPYYEAASALRAHHEQSIAQLSSLTAELGLLQSDLPSRQLSPEEEEYVRLLATARGLKMSLWDKISLYHDETNPLRESRRGGGGKLLGTKKYEKIRRNADRRGQAIVSCIDSYNSIVRRLEAMAQPGWVNPGAAPKSLKRSTVFSTEIDSELWSEITLGSAWSQLWNDDPNRPSSPPWAQNPDVRLGIKHKLLLDRISEEDHRLTLEEKNMSAWFSLEVQNAWRAYKNACQSSDDLEASLGHRIRRYISTLLSSRPMYLASPPPTAIWSLPSRVILAGIDTIPFHYFLRSTSDYLRASGAISPPNVGFASLGNSVVGDGLDSPMPSSGAVSESQECDDSDSENEENLALVADSVEREALGQDNEIFQDSENWGGPSRSSEDAVAQEEEEPCGTLRLLFRQDLQRPDRRYNLPPISLIFDAVDGQNVGRHTGRLPRQPSAGIWSVIRRSMSHLQVQNPNSTVRLPLDQRSRTIKQIVVPPTELPTLNSRRIISNAIIASFLQLLLDDHNAFPLLTGGMERPTPWIAPPCASHPSPTLLLNFFVQRNNTTRNAQMLSLDLWVVPLYAGRRDHWALGIIRLPRAGEPLRFQYIDSDPVVSEVMEAQGSSWAFRMLRRFYVLGKAIIECTDPSNISTPGSRSETVLLPAQRRLQSGGRSESAIWMLADVQAVLNGESSAPSSLNVEDYRLLIRHATLSLPESDSWEQTAWSDPESAAIVLWQANQFIATYANMYGPGPTPKQGEQSTPEGWWTERTELPKGWWSLRRHSAE